LRTFLPSYPPRMIFPSQSCLEEPSHLTLLSGEFIQNESVSLSLSDEQSNIGRISRIIISSDLELPRISNISLSIGP
jgi:hypothetical protein